MLLFLLIVAVLGTIALIFHISIELNGLEKRVSDFIGIIRKHYEHKPGA